MVASDGAVRVMDFGLAALRQTLHGPKTPRLTKIGSILGTPLYMSPEQLCGQTADPRADQFSFCVALYEALYGQRPFAGTDLAALMTSVTLGEVQPAPAGSRVPGWIRKILLRGLKVNADERWPSMTELLEALGDDPAVTRKKIAIWAGSGAAVVAGFVLLGLRPGLADPRQVCAGGPEKLAGIWELPPPGAPETPRQARLHQAFLGSGKSYARDVWATTSRALTNYARAWTDVRMSGSLTISTSGTPERL